MSDIAETADESGLSWGIAAVERETGIGKDTLRMWERRYGFPVPKRNSFGDRVYSQQDLDQLRLIRRLMDAGHRPGKLMGMPPEALRALGDTLQSPSAKLKDLPDHHADLENLLGLVAHDQLAELQNRLSTELARLGLSRFVTDLVAPLTRMVGLAWSEGQVQLFQEHAFTERVQNFLRQALSSMQVSSAGSRPVVLLATLPGELHGLGLLMAEALLRVEGCHCISLGTQTPVWEVARAVDAHRADVVALSFSSISAPQTVKTSLRDLRSALPGDVQIWAGGTGAALRPVNADEVFLGLNLNNASQHVNAWRKDHPSTSV